MTVLPILVRLALGASSLYSNFDGTAIHKTGPQIMTGPLTITGDPSLHVRGTIDNDGALYGGSIALNDPTRWVSTTLALLESNTTPTVGSDIGFQLAVLGALGVQDKLLSLTTNTVEQFYVNGVGGLYSVAGTLLSGIPPTGGVDTAWVMDTGALGATDKVVSFRLNTGEIAYVLGSGELDLASGLKFLSTTTGQLTSSVTPTAGQDTAFTLTTPALASDDYPVCVWNNLTLILCVMGAGGVYSASGNLISGVANTGGVDTSWRIRTVAGLTTADKIASFQLDSTEVAYVLGSGELDLASGLKFLSTTTGQLTSSTAATGGTDTGFSLNTSSTLASTDKLLSLSNNGNEYWYVMGAGGMYSGSGNYISGVAATGGADTAFTMKTQSGLASTDKILSLSVDTTEKAYVDGGGGIWTSSGFLTSGITPTGGTDTGFSIVSPSGMAGSDRLASFLVNVTEKAYVDANGTFNSLGSSTGANINYVTAYTTNSPLYLRGKPTDGATAIGIKATTTTTLSTDGAKIIAFYPDNSVTEVAYMSHKGAFRPATTIAAAPAEPYSCATGHEGEIIYSRDTDVGAGTYGGMCVCACDGGVPTCQWQKVNGGAACY